MPMRPRYPCPVCGRVDCTAHPRRIPGKTWHGQREYYPDAPGERKAKRLAVQAWVEQYGWWCPGYGREPHQSTDLTADHIVPKSRGGNPLGPFQVLCRSCNSRRGSARD